LPKNILAPIKIKANEYPMNSSIWFLIILAQTTSSLADYLVI
jgi:hypothetical protein